MATLDIDQSYYNIGTATVAANGTVVTGQGTLWQQLVRPNDLFGTHVGMPTRIKSVDSNTQITLAYPWKGPAQTAAAYEIQFTPYDVGYQAAVRQLLQFMASGNIEAFSALQGQADRFPFFTGAGTMDLTIVTAAARAFLNLAGTPVADRIPYLTSNNAAALATLTSLARDLLAGTSALAMRNTLAAQQALNTTGSIELGQLLSGDRVAYIDFHAEDGVDNSARIIRNAGSNGTLQIVCKGSGGIQLLPDEGANIVLSSRSGGVTNVTSVVSTPGIQFPAAQVASSNANTLDDYEEGSFTPTLTFGGGSTGIAYTSRVGRYQKVGNTVNVWINIQLSSKGSSVGAAIIRDLPFVSANGSPFYGGSIGFFSGTTGINQFTTAVPSGATVMNLYNSPGGLVQDTHVANTTHIIAFVSYEASS